MSLFIVDKKIRLIELFSGVGTQAMSMRDLGVDYENYKTSEWEVNAIASYKAIHCEHDNTDYSNGIERECLPDLLFELGISADGKNPMTLDQIVRKGEKWQRNVYNNIKATKNLVSITNFHGSDLEIVEKDKYCYVVTYSFPCQDLSVAGKGKGMDRGSGTRSGMLWEVERLLKECKELPQVLVMENVKNVIGKKNKDNFDEWLSVLESLGYSNYYDIMNAKDFEIPQNRERCFMISILGDYSFKFPEKKELKYRLKDILEREVDEKYYINSESAQRLIDRMVERYEKEGRDLESELLNLPLVGASRGRNPENPTCRESGLPTEQQLELNLDGVSNTLTSVTKDNYVLEKVGNVNPSENGMNGTVYNATGNNLAPTITTNKGEGPKVVVVDTLDDPRFGMDQNQRVYDTNGIAPALQTMQGGNRQPKIIEPVGIDKSYNNPHVIETANCITAREDRGISNHQAEGTAVVETLECYEKEEHNGGFHETCKKMNENANLPLAENDDIKINVLGVLPCKNGLFQTRNVLYDSNGLSPTLSATQYKDPYKIYYNLRIRKLTPLECWRLMDFTDEDYYKAEKVNSNAQLYKQAGNAIVKRCLMYLFAQLCGVEVPELTIGENGLATLSENCQPKILVRENLDECVYPEKFMEVEKKEQEAAPTERITEPPKTDIESPDNITDDKLMQFENEVIELRKKLKEKDAEIMRLKVKLFDMMENGECKAI